MNFIRNRSASLSMVVLVMFLVGFFQGSISYSISFGELDNLLPALSGGLLPALAFVVRGALLLIVFILWILNRKQHTSLPSYQMKPSRSAIDMGVSCAFRIAGTSNSSTGGGYAIIQATPPTPFRADP